MNPKVKMRAEIEAKCRQKYEEKLREAEKEFARQLAEAHLNYQRMLKMGKKNFVPWDERMGGRRAEDGN